MPNQSGERSRRRASSRITEKTKKMSPRSINDRPHAGQRLQKPRDEPGRMAGDGSDEAQDPQDAEGAQGSRSGPVAGK